MALSQKLFLLTLFTLPLQLNKFIFPDYSFVLGIPIDYRAIAIYLSDFAIIAYLTTFIIEYRSKWFSIYQQHRQSIIALFLLNYYLLFSSVLASTDIYPSLIFNIKTLELSLFALFAAVTLKNRQIFKYSIYVFSFSLIWQWVIVVFQFLLQKSIGFSYLGERSFDVSTSGIAHVQFLGSLWLRPYGTFPHPNVLGAFFILAMILITSYFPINRKYYLIKPVIFAAAISSIAFTFSKAAILTLLTIFTIASQKIKFLLLKLVIIIGLISTFLLLLTQGQINSIAERFILADVAMTIFRDNILFGVGSNNFILELSKLDLLSISETRLLQPVHNVFFLILSENGLIGFLLFAFLIFTIFKHTDSKPKLALFVCLLIFMSVDHFLWTLHQGRLLLFISIAYILKND